MSTHEPAAAAHAPAPHAPAAAGHGAHGSPEEHEKHYKKIWGILCLLLVISVAGPFLGVQAVTLLTAFGVAVVKAYLVVTNFMHLNLEKKFIGYLMATMLILMGLFYGGVSPDVMNHDGQRWENTAAKAETARRMASEPSGHEAAAPHEGKAAH